MNLDEFAFLNQQLAGMLRAGIPLEGGLRQLSSTMRRGRLRAELEALQNDLAAGVPLTEAIGRRDLPELYVRLTQAGSQDLPGVLTMLADYYNRLATVLTRLKGLMVYPLIVLLASLGVSLLITLVYRSLILAVFYDGNMVMPALGKVFSVVPGIWLPSLIIFTLLAIWLIVMFTPRFRRWARWRLPGFREASLAQFAATASLLLKSGATLEAALGLLQKAEEGGPAGREVARWLELHRQGIVKWTSFTANSRVFPPLFIWLVAQGGENMAQGFQRASDIYHARSTYKIDLLLYAAMPMAVMAMAGLIVGQMYPVIKGIKAMFENLGL
jgi:type II secretory pathway component PulF